MTTGAQTPRSPARPPRSRLRTFLPLGVAAWLVLEIWLLVLVAGASSGFVVFLLLVAGVVLGSVVIKAAGRRAFRNLTETLNQQQSGTPPEAARPNSEGNGLMMLGGLLLILPGLISDALGLLMLLPPVQKAVSRYAQRTVERKLRAAGPGTLGDAFRQARMHRPDGKVVQGEVIRDDPDDTPQDPRPPLTR
ncbi:FxsA family membrane protein [Streptomyces coelicoflavus]|uniref:FxsA family membrane protein n=1 Tax=Streptomyces TaxID=1883 RepID=UPI0002477062|nr:MULTISPECIES: FxsA family membrane protein [Streptomyces]EHN74168.1 putative membrane protein [Streptomyces coelicoflavus ZG0656]KPC72916.1 membrane protein [Streptomyces sp. NRRL WC-3753]MZE43970.1 FxsA family protein [Streptomyces sp. SID5477]KAF2781336.1 membrane protein [Streptomyces sp. OM5714]MCX5039039.1 FxsA family protein [Streptomyces coelicoflavus]